MVRQQHADDPQQIELLRVCRIGRAQGLKGEVNVRLFTSEPEERFAPGSVLYTKDGAQTYVVAHSRTFKDRWIVSFEGVADRNASEALNGLELYGEADDAEAMLDDDAWYPKDLVGLQARLADDNQLGLPADQVIGTVVDVLDGPQSLLKIRRPAQQSPAANDEMDHQEPEADNTALVPFVEQLVPDIDLDQEYLTIDPPGGLIPWL